MRDDGELDFEVFRPVKRCTEVEIGNVKRGKGGIRRGESDVDEELNLFK